MNTGFIALHRKFKDWEWYKDANTKAVFVHLLISATYKEKSYQGIPLHPGDILMSERDLAKETGLSRQNVRTAIEHLLLTHELTQRATQRGRVLTLVNWRKYQPSSDGGNPQTNPQTNQSLTQHQPKGNPAPTQNNKDNKENNINNINKTTNNNNDSGGSLIERLSDSEWESLNELYENLIGLLDEVEKPGADYSEIRNPYKYILGAADRLNWPVKPARRVRALPQGNISNSTSGSIGNSLSCIWR